MPIHHLITLFDRDLKKLSQEVSAYSDESILWQVSGLISNSAGNLCLHILGNLNAFIGAELGQTGYIRHREQEFGLKDVPRLELLKSIDATNEMIRNTLSSLNPKQLEAPYPLQVFGKEMTTLFFLMHLTTHLTYHLGQINYHRRLLDN